MSDSNGLFGMDPQTARNLLMFGASTMAAANARTPQGFLAYGAGAMGPIGAGLMGMNEQAIQQAKLGSELAYQRAQTQQLQNQNQLFNLEMPYIANSIGGATSGAGMAQMPMGAPAASSGPLPVVQRDKAQTAGMQANNPGNLMYADQPDATGTIPLSDNRRLAAFPDMQTGVAANARQLMINADQHGVQSVRQMVQRWVNDPKANLDSYVTDTANAIGVNPDAPVNWHDPNVQAAFIQAQYPHESAGGSTSLQQSDVLEGVRRANGGTRSFQVAQAGNGAIPMPGGALQQQSAPQSSGINQDAMMKAQQYYNAAMALPPMNIAGLGDINAARREALLAQAKQWQEFALAGPKAGAEAGARNASELQYAGPLAQKKAEVELQYAGPMALAKAQNSPIDLRQGGLAGIPMGNGQYQFYKNPQLEPIQDPATGATYYGHMAPAPPNAPPGTPGTVEPVIDSNGQPALKALPHNLQEARNKSYSEFAGKDTDAYIAAQNTQGWLEQMDHAADTLTKAGGMVGMGPTSPARISFANNVNDILRTAGLPTVFDQNAIASWEELKKATTTAGFELSSHYEGHARQAAATIENATSAVPSASNSPVGFHVVSAGIREAAQSAIDAHNYKQSIYDQNGDLNRAEVDFYKQNPPQMYARRAISTVTPYPITRDEELSRYLPGTFVRYKGNIVQVPERHGAPPIPDYLKKFATPPSANAPEPGAMLQ